MSIDWGKTAYLERESNIYSFSQNPLIKRNHNIHLYMPWDDSREKDLMFKIKDHLSKKGHANLAYMEKSGHLASIPLEFITKINAQLLEGRETHLIMSNMNSIHIFRISRILNSKDIKNQHEFNISFYGEKESKYSTWIQVDDLFVLDANHDGDKSGVSKELQEFVSSTQTQNIFKPRLQTITASEDTSLDSIIPPERWVDINRSLTYDYFIRSCELKDNIFQDSWKFLSRKTQHELISCELERHNAIFYRDHEKWKYLTSSFECYREAIFSELNSVYIFPFVNAISTYASLKEAWCELDQGLVNPKISKLIGQLLSGEKKQIDSLEDFLYYIQNAKSLFFSLKKKFSRKIHKEEFLLVENFLCRQESLVEAMNCSPLVQKLKLTIEIKEWITQTTQNMSDAPNVLVKDCNLRLSHLLSIMVSASYQDNIFFRLIEEKAAKGIVQKSYEDVVKSLLNIDLKKAA